MLFRSTSGRESPFRATERGGAWRPMPSPRAYLGCVSKHDAFPSGHIATLTTTFTVLIKNYPDKFWLKPVGAGAGVLLMFAMLNNGVHWAGDYPLGIAIGYVAGSTVFDLRKPDAATAKSDGHALQHDLRPWSLSVAPLVAPGKVGMVFNASL